MEEERKQMRIEKLLSVYFSNFLRIITLNIIFLIPSAVFVGIVYFLSQWLFHGQNIFVMFLPVILIYPFYSGIVLVTRNIARGDKDIKTCSLYFKTLKENFLIFLLHGAVLYFVTVISYLGVTFYFGMGKTVSWIFYPMLFVLLIIILLALFTFFYVPLMSVTYDISTKNIYKNSFLMSFGEIKNNLLALLSLIIVLAVYGTVIILCYFNKVLFVISIAVVFGLFIPASASYVINFFVYDGMNDMISHKEEKRQILKEKRENAGKTPKKKAPDFSGEDFSGIDISKLRDPDGYIYYNGKMVKQGYILEKLKEKETEKQDG